MGTAMFLFLAAAAVFRLSTGSGMSLQRRPRNSAGGLPGSASPVSGRAASLQGLSPRQGGTATGVLKVPLLLDLLGTALESGLTISNALQVVAQVSGGGIRESLFRVSAALEIGASWQDAWQGNTGSSELAALHAALSFGALSGAGAAPLLYAEAAHIRKAGGRQAEKRAAALGVKLVLPLGLCSLPAFVALGIVPVVIAMVPAL